MKLSLFGNFVYVIRKVKFTKYKTMQLNQVHSMLNCKLFPYFIYYKNIRQIICIHQKIDFISFYWFGLQSEIFIEMN